MRAGPAHDLDHVRLGVVVEAMHEPEAAAQRRRQQAGARRRRDQRERLHRHLHRARARPLADDDVELVVLHRRIEDFLDRRREAVDLVDEQHLVALQRREDRREVAGTLDHRAGRGLHRHAEFVGDDVRQRRLAEARRARDQHVVERFVALARRRNRDLQVLADAVLADVVVERARPQSGLVLRLVVAAASAHHPRVRHACLAALTRVPAGRGPDEAPRRRSRLAAPSTRHRPLSRRSAAGSRG